MKPHFLVSILITVVLFGETTEHECSSIRWVDLDTVVVDGQNLGQLPALLGQDSNGNTVNLLEVQKEEQWKILIISYMAEWCGNCRFEAPVVKQVFQSYHPSGLNQIIVMEYSTMKGAMKFVEQFQLPMPVYFGQVRAKQEDKKHLTQHYLLRRSLADGRDWGTPFHIIIERGNLKRVGYVAGEFKQAELEAYLDQKLRLPGK
ncbi:MAG: TlpA family protein disulfide reductase [Fidelibacterota bacterium]